MPNDNAFLANASRHQRKETPQQRKPRPFNVQTALIVFALLLIATSFLLGNKEKTAPVNRIEISTNVTQPSGATDAINRDTTVAAPTANDLLDGDRARLLINTIWTDGKQQPEEVYQEAEKLRSSKKFTDAWLLYFYSARQGHGASSAALASMSDPHTYNTFGTPLSSADEFQALKWYSMANAQGYADSNADFLRLKKQISTQAITGDSHAKQLLLQLENL